MSPLALSLRFLQAQPDHRLAELARNGHEPAFEALVRRYRGELLAYCRRLQPTTGSAEDALQQTFLQAWKALNAGTEVRELRPWLYRIAHNVSLNSLRVVTAVPAEMPETAAAQEVDHLVEQRLRIRAAFTELAALPALQRQAFVSSMLEGASHDEVAASLGVSSGAVRGLIYRARSAMRAAAAALTPSPVVGWAVRRAETQTGSSATIAQAVAGGGGTGLVAALAKGGAVLTLAGAVAGAGGAILTPSHHHRHLAATRPTEASQVSLAASGRGPEAAHTLLVVAAGRPGAAPAGPLALTIAGRSHSVSGTAGRRGAHPADGHGSAGSGDGSSTRSGGGPGPSGGGGAPSRSGSGSDGSSSGGSDGGSSGGSDGGSSGGLDGASTGTATVAANDGGTSGGGSGGDGGEPTTSTATSDGSSGGDGGSSGSTSGGGSGSDSRSGSSVSVSTVATSASH